MINLPKPKVRAHVVTRHAGDKYAFVNQAGAVVLVSGSMTIAQLLADGITVRLHRSNGVPVQTAEALPTGVPTPTQNPAPACRRCGDPCQHYGGVDGKGGYSVMCQKCNEHNALLSRQSRARCKE